MRRPWQHGGDESSSSSTPRPPPPLRRPRSLRIGVAPNRGDRFVVPRPGPTPKLFDVVRQFYGAPTEPHQSAASGEEKEPAEWPVLSDEEEGAELEEVDEEEAEDQEEQDVKLAMIRSLMSSPMPTNPTPATPLPNQLMPDKTLATSSASTVRSSKPGISRLIGMSERKALEIEAWCDYRGGVERKGDSDKMLTEAEVLLKIADFFANRSKMAQ